jgi:Bacterial Ig-like domain (group 3)/FlgD Ig-like domain
MRTGDRRRSGVVAVIFVVLTLLVSALPVAADTGDTPTTVDPILSSMEPQPVGRTATLSVGLEPNEVLGSGGTVTFYRLDGVTEIALGTASIVNLGGPSASVDLPSDLGIGSYEVFARFSGTATFAPSESAHSTIHVGPRPTGTDLQLGTSGGSIDSVEPGTTVYTNWAVTDLGSYLWTGLPDSGTVTITLDGVTVDSGTMHQGGSIATSALAVGTHTVEASFGGSTDFDPSTDSATFTVVANVVHATGVTLDVSTFYPRHDGYRDVVHAKGTRLEPASVTVKVYDPKGHKIRTLTLASGSGAYSLSWNGRNTAGTLMPAGKYKVVQILKDTAGKTLTVTKDVSLSTKILVSKTSYVSKQGKSLTTSSHTGSATVTKASSGYVKLSVGSGGPGLAFAGWQFTLPSAISYSKLTLQIDDKAPLVTGPNSFGLQDFGTCPYIAAAPWDLACVAPQSAIGKGTRAWQSLTGYPNAGSSFLDRSGRTVRAMVAMNYSTAYVYTVRVKVTYKILH